ncbi:MAG: pilus assembly protein [Acidobacteria bacterium]|nr:pilus assembly protein [Acidobacteriota bacterium]
MKHQSNTRKPAIEIQAQHSGGESQSGRRRFFLGRHSERGQSMVELAFVLPIFLGLVLGIIEIGRAWAAKQTLVLAAREGARVLMTAHGAGLPYSSESEKQAAAVNAVKSYMNSAGVPVEAGTQIIPVRLSPGNDGAYGTGDDATQPEPNYTGGQRGERVGIYLRHSFETPLPILLKMFDDGTHNTPEQSAIVMGVTCYMDHE